LNSRLVNSVIKEVEDNKSEVVNLCSKLVQFQTKNPPGITIDCANYIKEYFNKLRIPSKIYQRNEGKANICATLDGKKPGKIMYLMHLDVVPEGDRDLWGYDPYGGIVADGKVYGRGSSDMKGSGAAAMVAARILSKVDPNERCTIDFWFTCDEEIGGTDGAKWLAESGKFKADICLEGDCFMFPEDPSIDIGCSGSMRTILKIIGKAAHGSQPHLGDNAIDKLIKVLEYAKKLEEFPLEVFDEMKPVYDSAIKYYKRQKSLTTKEKAGFAKYFQHPSVSLNLIKGGIKSNVVPDEAEAYLDIRIRSGCNLPPIKQRMLELIKESGAKEITADISSPSPGYYENPESKPVKQLVKAVEISAGRKPALKILMGGNDCTRIKSAKLPTICIGFGAGDEGIAHLTNEYVTIVNLIMTAKVYAIFPLMD
jgi:succinyl-diaminopimelate desuccinylase